MIARVLVCLTLALTLSAQGLVETSVKGKVILEGNEEAPPARLMLNGFTALIGPDGTFDVPGIQPGHGLSKVEGRVAAGGATVLLIPLDRSLGRPIGRNQSDSDGSFSISGVAPGRYTLVAIDDVQGLAYADPAVIAPYLQHGQVVTVPINKVADVEVQKRLE